MEITAHLREAAESWAVVELRPRGGALPAGFEARLIGPHCRYARTLPTEHVAEVDAQRSSTSARILVTEPCYWTPALPFLYRLQLTGRDESNRPATSEHSIGLRRLACVRGSLIWNARRVVLRGAAVDNATPAALQAAREAEVTLLIARPPIETCAAADELGVALLADLRGRSVDADELERVSLHASVAIILVDAHQVMPCDLDRLTPQSIVAVAVYLDDAPEFSELRVPSWCDAVVVELEEKALPSEAPSKWGKPVIAIRRGVTYADFHAARAACDRLQADLAPEFDLAGYFVAP